MGTSKGFLAAAKGFWSLISEFEIRPPGEVPTSSTRRNEKTLKAGTGKWKSTTKGAHSSEWVQGSDEMLNGLSEAGHQETVALLSRFLD